ncbi:MAG: hypothetical protein JSR46_09715, partial [Verrucomicrobia bacterium]|nr:hypothetical protein [Verrucomicrobiota bacterium]
AIVKVLIPAVQEIYPIAQSILVPAAKVVYSIAQSLFVTLPEKIYANVIEPFGKFMYSSVLVPAGQLIEAVSNATLVPACRALASGVRLLNEKILQPAALVFSTVMQYAFVEVPKHLYTALIVPAQAGLEHIGQVAAACIHALKQTWPLSAL